VNELSGRTILLVEDRSDVGSSIAAMLRRLGGATVHQRSSVEQAMELLRISSADVVVSDFLLNTTTGLALALQIRNAGHSLPIVIVTGAPDLVAEECAMNHVSPTIFAGVYEKPINTVAFLRGLQTTLT